MPVIDEKPLTASERTSCDFLDSMIEGRVRSAKVGSWVEVSFPFGTTPKVVNVLKKSWEIRGNGVGIFGGGGDAYRVVISPARAVTIPALTASAFAFVQERGIGPRMLVRMPTRGRPGQALAVLADYRRLAGYPIAIEVVLDEDDHSMLSAAVLQRLCALGCSVAVAPHKSKVEAVNGGRANEWDILVLASDDMVPVVDGYAKILVDEMQRHWPRFDGAIFQNDGYARDRCCTLPVFGRRLYDQFGYIYHPDYKSLCCDVEQTEVLRATGRLVYIDQILIEHRHPDTGNTATDHLYKRNNDLRERDSQVFTARRAIRRAHAPVLEGEPVGFDTPSIALSVLIATLPARQVQLDLLLAHLYGQIVRDAPREVEVLVDDAGGTIGAKRQRLLERATGKYVAFVDDDDWLAHDYVRKVVGKIHECEYGVDCLSLAGVLTTNGECPERFRHSVDYSRWYQDASGLHCRTPNHLNPVRRELALAAGFPDIVFGEDHQYSKRLRPLLKTEAGTTGNLYFYWFWKKTV